MLHLLLDEHISAVVARQLRHHHPEIHITSLSEWKSGTYLGSPDQVLLATAYKHHLTLVTYDLRTIMPLLKEWHESGVSHGGVIFVDGKSIAPNDFGGLVRALKTVNATKSYEEWNNQVLFLSAD